MSKSRIRSLFVFFVSVIVLALILLKIDGADAAMGFLSGIGDYFLFLFLMGIAIVLIGGIWIKHSSLDKNSIYFLSGLLFVCILAGVILLRSEIQYNQMVEEKGTLAAIEKDPLTTEDLGLVHMFTEKVDKGESYWKSYLEYTVTLANYGSIQYNCDRFTDKEDASKRLDDYIKSDGYRGESIVLPLEISRSELDRMEAYEWIPAEVAEEGSDSEPGMRIFYYYLQKGDMVFRMKYRNTLALEDDQIGVIIEWFLRES